VIRFFCDRRPRQRRDYICVYAYENICASCNPCRESACRIVSRGCKYTGKLHQSLLSLDVWRHGTKTIRNFSNSFNFRVVYVAYFESVCNLGVTFRAVSPHSPFHPCIRAFFSRFRTLPGRNHRTSSQNCRGESPPTVSDYRRLRVQRHKNLTHCRVMNIMATNGISPPLATNSLTASLSSLFYPSLSPLERTRLPSPHS